MTDQQKLFRKGSAIYYFSNRLLPKKVREDVYRLYSFVHRADNYVEEDRSPKKLQALEKMYDAAVSDSTYDATAHLWDDEDTTVVKYIVRLQHLHKLDPEHIKNFLAAMKSDLEQKSYKTFDDTMVYVRGSAESLAVMAATIMKLPEEAFEAAKAQARAIQWLNFIRDIGTDAERGRQFFPDSDLKKYGLKTLTSEEAAANPEQFKKFIRFQLGRYKKWQTEANKDIHLIPERLRVGIKTATDMFEWMAVKIEAEPLIVFDNKLRASKRKFVGGMLSNAVVGTARATAQAARSIKLGTRKAVPAAKAAMPAIKEKAAEATDALMQKTDEVREKLPGSEYELPNLKSLIKPAVKKQTTAIKAKTKDIKERIKA